MENDLRKLFFTTFLTLTVLLGGCDVTKKLDEQSAEIDRLNSLLNQQYGIRAADLDFAERQVAVFQGCTFLFNVCSTATLTAGEKYIKGGFTGSSSAWWWVAFIGKLAGVAVFFGAMLWLPWHFFVLFTRPAKIEIDEAKNLIAGLDAKVNDANRKRTQTLQQASATRRDFERLSSSITEQQKKLATTEQAVAQAEAQLSAANTELAKATRLKDSFRQF